MCAKEMEQKNAERNRKTRKDCRKNEKATLKFGGIAEKVFLCSEERNLFRVRAPVALASDLPK